MTRRSFSLAAVGLLTLLAGAVAAQDRETKVRNDRKLLEASTHWIYNDLPRGIREAQRTQRPILLVFRCIPCEACHEFDEQVVERDPQVRELLDKFVCVRIPQANGLDLSKFQFDYDMSFAVMYLHHDGTVLGRFGTRTGRDNERDDMHLAGFAESLARVLDLHRDIDRQRGALIRKLGLQSAVKAPEDFPSLKGKYTDKLNYEGKVVQSCIHCHQVREAQRLVYRSAGQPLPDDLLFPWPGLSIVGLKADPKTATTIAAVAADSPAARAGLQPGDKLLSFDGQPLVSVADAQWVLQQTGDSGTIAVVAERNGKTVQTKLELAPGWRRASDISWRATTWDLRRMAFGGMVLEPISADERAALQLPVDKLALRVKHVGQYGDHARAKQAGVQKDDIVTAYDGRTAAASESDLLAYALQQKKAGDKVELALQRGGRTVRVTLTLQ